MERSAKLDDALGHLQRVDASRDQIMAVFVRLRRATDAKGALSSLLDRLGREQVQRPDAFKELAAWPRLKLYIKNDTP
jgi:hypothetical protein